MKSAQMKTAATSTKIFTAIKEDLEQNTTDILVVEYKRQVFVIQKAPENGGYSIVSVH